MQNTVERQHLFNRLFADEWAFYVVFILHSWRNASLQTVQTICSWPIYEKQREARIEKAEERVKLVSELKVLQQKNRRVEEKVNVMSLPLCVYLPNFCIQKGARTSPIPVVDFKSINS